MATVDYFIGLSVFGLVAIVVFAESADHPDSLLAVGFDICDLHWGSAAEYANLSVFVGFHLQLCDHHLEQVLHSLLGFLRHPGICLHLSFC